MYDYGPPVVEEKQSKTADLIRAAIGLALFVGLTVGIVMVISPLAGWLNRKLSTGWELELQRERAQQWHELIMIGQQVVIAVLLVGVVALILLGVVSLILKIDRARRMVYAKDGVYPVERRTVGGGWKRVLRKLLGRPVPPIREIVIDHNLSPVHVRVYGDEDGLLTFQGSPDWQDERNRLASVQATKQARNIQALTHGGGTHLHRPTAGAMRALMEQRQPKQMGYAPSPPDIDDDLPVQIVQPTLLEAVKQSDDPDELVLAYDPDTGDPVYWSVRYDPGMAVHGAQRQGKTYLALVPMLAAAAQDWHVIVLDPEGGKDFRPFAHVFEWHATSTQMVVPQLQVIMQEFDRRHALLDEAQVGDFRALPEGTLRRTLLVMEEFKKLRASMDAMTLRTFDGLVSELVTRGAKVGIYLMVLAQDKGKDMGGWPETLDVNLTGKATVRQGKKGYGNVGYFNAHKLGPREVGYQDTVVKAFEVAGPSLKRLEARIRPPTPLIPDDLPGLESQNQDPLPGREIVHVPDIQDVDESLQWDDVVDQWFAANPQALEGPPNGINDLARTIAAADGYPPDPDHVSGWPFNWRQKQSVAHEYYHRRRAQHEAGEWSPSSPAHVAATETPGLDNAPGDEQSVPAPGHGAPEAETTDLSKIGTYLLLDWLETYPLDSEAGQRIYRELDRRKVPGLPRLQSV